MGTCTSRIAPAPVVLLQPPVTRDGRAQAWGTAGGPAGSHGLQAVSAGPAAGGTWSKRTVHVVDVASPPRGPAAAVGSGPLIGGGGLGSGPAVPLGFGSVGTHQVPATAAVACGNGSVISLNRTDSTCGAPTTAATAAGIGASSPSLAEDQGGSSQTLQSSTGSIAQHGSAAVVAGQVLVPAMPNSTPSGSPSRRRISSASPASVTRAGPSWADREGDLPANRRLEFGSRQSGGSRLSTNSTEDLAASAFLSNGVAGAGTNNSNGSVQSSMSRRGFGSAASGHLDANVPVPVGAALPPRAVRVSSITNRGGPMLTAHIASSSATTASRQDLNQLVVDSGRPPLARRGSSGSRVSEHGPSSARSSISSYDGGIAAMHPFSTSNGGIEFGPIPTVHRTIPDARRGSAVLSAATSGRESPVGDFCEDSKDSHSRVSSASSDNSPPQVVVPETLTFGPPSSFSELQASAHAAVTPMRLRFGSSALEHVDMTVDEATNKGAKLTPLQCFQTLLTSANVPVVHQERLASMLQDQTYPQGEFLFRQGDLGDKFFVIMEGEVELSRWGVSGYTEAFTRLFQGDCFGEASLLGYDRRNANAMAVDGDVQVKYLTKTQFTQLVQEDSSFRMLMEGLRQRNEANARRRAELARNSQFGMSPDKTMNMVKYSQLTRWGQTASNQLIMNDYCFTEPLGSGSFSKVYLAVRISDSHPFAVKAMDLARIRKKAATAMSPNRQQHPGYQSEVEVMAKLRHKNIVSLIEVVRDEERDRLFLVTEFVHGGPVMKESNMTSLAVTLARRYFRDTLLGLQYLKFQAVAHLDIKPANLLVTHDGRIKLADFGCAAMLEDDVPLRARGTPAFMAPEMFSETTPGDRFDAYAADMYSLGATLYCMLMGHPPFMADTELKLVPLILNQAPRLPPHVEAIPPLKHLLNRLLDKNPKTRLTLEGACVHPWVTAEGVDPLPTQAFQFM